MPTSYTEDLRIEDNLHTIYLFIHLYCCVVNVLVLCRQFSHAINTVGEKIEINKAFSAVVHGSRT